MGSANQQDLSPLERPMPRVAHWLLLGRRGTHLTYGNHSFPLVHALAALVGVLAGAAAAFVFTHWSEKLPLIWRCAIFATAVLLATWAWFLVRFWNGVYDYMDAHGGAARDSEKSRQQRRAEARRAAKRGIS